MWIHPSALRRSWRAAALLLLLPAVAGAAVPFYELRLREGIRAYAGGNYDAAARDLRIACFGLLEEPESLARCLTYLALAQAGAGDREAFSACFLRIVEIEERFAAYTGAELEPHVRQAFETQLELWEPYEALRAVPAFSAVARRMVEARVVALPPADRRRELERRLAAEPRDPVWRLLTAELELAAGNFETARAAAEQVLGQEPQDPLLPRALCIRGRALAALGGCETALRDLASCAPLGIDASDTKLQCYAQLGDWKRGIVLLSELPDETRRRPALRKLARLFEKERRLEIREIERAPVAEPPPGVPAAGVPAAGAPVAEQTAPAEGDEDEAGAEATATAPPPADAPAAGEGGPGERVPAASELTARIEEARRIFQASDSRAELTALGERMRAEAERSPGHRDLQIVVAEISYRLRRWSDAVTFFERGGGPAADRPDQRFYLAVALYETGDLAAAAEALELCLPHLEPSAIVRSYAAKIRGEEG